MKYCGEELLTKFRAGDQRAQKEVFEMFYDALNFISYSIINDEEQAKDIVIEVLAKFFENNEDFETLLVMSKSLIRRVKKASFDFLEKLSRRKVLYRRYASGMDISEEISKTGIDLTYTREICNSCYGVLPPQTRRILQMIYEDGIKQAKIAQKLDISPGTVQSLRQFGLRRMKRNLLRIRTAKEWLVELT